MSGVNVAEPDGPVAEIDLGAVRRNAARLQARAQGKAAMLVAVKADAYGHGLVPVARSLARGGVGWFGVATANEALALRQARVPGRILLFQPQRLAVLPALLAANVDLTVAAHDDLEAVLHARSLLRATPSEATRSEAPVSDAALHLKVDTGMGRLGLRPAEARALADRIDASDGVRLTAVWTHLARADEPDLDTTDRQADRFDAFLADLAQDGIRPELRHAANSAGLLAHPRTHYDLVRPGLAVFGCCPGAPLAERMEGFEATMRFTAPVTFVKRVRTGESLSYGHRYTAPSDRNVATVRVGYADGYPRALSNRGEAGLAGKRAQVVGAVCMDQTLLDLDQGQAQVGDRAVLFGPGGPTPEALASRIGTIPYELLTSVASRVLRRYRDDGR